MVTSYQENSNSPIAVLLGHTGVGKTLIYNKLCNTNHSLKYNKGTNLIFDHRLNDVSHGECRFKVIDTPGNNSKGLPI